MATSNHERNTALLQAAAKLIESRQPARQASLRHPHQGMPPRTDLFLVRFDFPGVVSVYTHDTGALVVRSLPGKPTVPDVLATLGQGLQL